MSLKPLVSVLISTYNSATTLEALLHSVREQSYQCVETVIVDNHSSDATLEIAHRYTNKVFSMGPERSAQRNYAAEKSSGDILLVLDSDMLLTREVIGEVVERFNSAEEELALVIPEESFGVGFWSACKKLERSFYIGVSWMEAARAFRRKAFIEMLGYDVFNTGTEDYDLPHRIEERFGTRSIGRINSFIQHNEGRLELIKTCKKKFYYARALDVYTQKKANKSYFTKQASPISRFCLYFKKPQILFNKPIIGLGMIYMKICEMLSGAIGYVMRSNSANMQKSIYK